MILCNETVAAHCQNNNIPQIYRTHDAPSQEKLANLSTIVKSLGLSLPVHVGPTAIQRILEQCEDTPAYYMVAMAALTSLPQAIYSPNNPQHYGLASEAYCHFTSPIRRYSDLQAHRVIKGQCSGADLQYISTQCSSTERNAESLEREVVQLKKVQFMQDKLGRQYEAKVSGVTPWGVYALIDGTVEGLVPKRHLKHSGFAYNKEKNHYISKRNPVISMGASILVELISANEDERKLCFHLVKSY